MLNLTVLNALYNDFAINVMGTAEEGQDVGYFKAGHKIRLAKVNENDDRLQHIIYVLKEDEKVMEIFSLTTMKKEVDIFLEFMYSDDDFAYGINKRTSWPIIKAMYESMSYDSIKELVDELNGLD